MGFQSYPGMKTIAAFALPEERRPDSAIMYKHQKSGSGNQTIEHYMGEYFDVPKDFGLYIYASQITAGEIQRCAIEHMRQNRGRCMGVITWQLNDCWPAVSWAGLDYFGRWKAQQYYSKRFFAPVLISAAEQARSADIYVTNDTLEDITASLRWALKNNRGQVLTSGEGDVTVEALSAKNCLGLDFEKIVSNFDPHTSYLEYALQNDRGELACGTSLFVPPKDFCFLDPEISVSVEDAGDVFVISLTVSNFAKWVALDLTAEDCIFSDNFFDVSKGAARRITVEKSTLSKPLDTGAFKAHLSVTSIYGMERDASGPDGAVVGEVSL
jgi:beta-mannosidase